MQHKRGSNWFGWIVVLALVAGASYGAWWYWKNRRTTAHNTALPP